MDPARIHGRLDGPGRSRRRQPAAPQPSRLTPQDLERRQAIWWYLLFGGILLLATETILSNRISRV